MNEGRKSGKLEKLNKEKSRKRKGRRKDGGWSWWKVGKGGDRVRKRKERKKMQ